MKKLPESVQVLGKVYTIQVKALAEMPDDYGQCEDRFSRISIVDQVSEDQRRDTVLHEVLHAIDHAMDTEMSERQVRLTATGILTVLRANPKLTAYLLDATTA